MTWPRGGGETGAVRPVSWAYRRRSLSCRTPLSSHPHSMTVIPAFAGPARPRRPRRRRDARAPCPRRVLFRDADASAPAPYANAALLDRRRPNAYALRRAHANRCGRAYARAYPYPHAHRDAIPNSGAAVPVDGVRTRNVARRRADRPGRLRGRQRLRPVRMGAPQSPRRFGRRRHLLRYDLRARPRCVCDPIPDESRRIPEQDRPAG